MRALRGTLLCLNWVVVAALGLAPLWLRRFGTVTVWVDPPEYQATVQATLVGVFLLLVVVLSVSTWRFIRSARA